jgi:hypothetical protein
MNSDASIPTELEGLQLNLTAIDIGGCDPDEIGDVNIFWDPDGETDVGRWLKVLAPIHAMEVKNRTHLPFRRCSELASPLTMAKK